jgi:succinyl-CoA synthetase beta subunit
MTAVNTIKTKAPAGAEQRSAAVSVKWLMAGAPVGVIGYGGGMALAITDWLASEGMPVNGIIDIDEAVSANRTDTVLRETLSLYEEADSIRVILVSIVLASKSVSALAAKLVPVLQARTFPAAKPIILHFQGYGAAEATAHLEQHGFTNALCLRDAVKRIRDTLEM